MITTGRAALEKPRQVDLTKWLSTRFGKRPESFEIGPYTFDQDCVLVDRAGLVVGNRFGISFGRFRSKNYLCLTDEDGDRVKHTVVPAPDEESKLALLIKTEIAEHSKWETLFERLQAPRLNVSGYVFNRNEHNSDSTQTSYVLRQSSDFNVDFSYNRRLNTLSRRRG